MTVILWYHSNVMRVQRNKLKTYISEEKREKAKFSLFFLLLAPAKLVQHFLTALLYFV